MNQKLRNEIQEKIIQIAKSRQYNGVIRASIRLGKTYIGLMCINTNLRTLVCYPKVTIKQSWLDEIEKHNFYQVQPEYSTFASLKKLVKSGEKYNRIIVDEIHKLSANNRKELKQLISSTGSILGLTGTLRLKSEKALDSIGVPVIAQYDLEDAITDGLVKDYKLFIHFVKLDNIHKQFYDSLVSKYDYFRDLDDVESMLISEGKGDANKQRQYVLGWKKYRGLITNYIYNSSELTDKAQELIHQYKDKKTLIFSLRTNVADELSLNSYHSKDKNLKALEEFQISEQGHLSTVNMISEGITIHHLNNIICHTVTSNTEDFQQKLGRGLQLGDINGEVCAVHCICLKDTIQERWIELCCKSLNQHKIYYIIDKDIKALCIDGEIHCSKINYIKAANQDKELYLYKGSYCYPSSVNTEGYQMYKFLGDSQKEYSISKSKLIKL